MGRRRLTAAGILVLLLSAEVWGLSPEQLQWAKAFFYPLRRWRVDFSTRFGPEKLAELNRPVKITPYKVEWPVKKTWVAPELLAPIEGIR